MPFNLHAAAVDGYQNVIYKITRQPLCDLEKVEFEEQYLIANDDAERVALCRRWSSIYEPPLRKARTR